MRYVPQKKAEIMYNSYSGRKNNVFQKVFFLEFNSSVFFKGLLSVARERELEIIKIQIKSMKIC